MKHPSRSTAALMPLLMLIAACGREEEQPAANTNAGEGNRSAARAEAAPVPSLAGQWTVAEINGNAPRQVWPMVATVTSDEFAIQSECRRFAWKYRQDRNIVHFTPMPVRECARVRSPDETQIEDPIALANIAMFSKDGRDVQLTGPGGRIALTRR